MRCSPIMYLLLLLIPTFLSAQVLQQENPESHQLKDPDKFPFSFTTLLGLPGTAASYDLGYQELYSLIQSKGINLPKFRTMLFYGVGIRYKRFHADISLSSLIAPFNLEPYGSPRFNTVSSQSVNSLNFGFTLFQNRNSSFLLKAGYGEASSSFWITPLRAGNEIDFDQIDQQEDPVPFPHIFHRSTFVDVGIELIQGRAKSRTSISQNLRLGYKFGTNERAWEIINARTVNAPVDRFSQIYLQIMFNFGLNFPQKNKS